MSLRGPYSTQVAPPAPFVPVTLSDPINSSVVATAPAQVDTAADRTVVPMRIIESLGLEPIDDLYVSGFGGSIHKISVYLVTLALQTFPPETLRVLAHANEKYVLLGRDVLNNHRIILDGPNQILEIT
jgi:predicted aspartyl protease